VALVQGGFDLAIRVGRPADSSLRAQWLGAVPVRLVASPAYISKNGAPKKPSEIQSHACISVGVVAGPVEWNFYRGKKRESVGIEGMVHTTSPTLAAQLCKAGLGLMRTTEWVVREELKKRELVEVMPEWACDDPRFGGVPAYILYAQSASAVPPLKSRVFADMVKEIVATEVLGRKR
jgi:DNA-binding transcriptional LysR family regulator